MGVHLKYQFNANGTALFSTNINTLNMIENMNCDDASDLSVWSVDYAHILCSSTCAVSLSTLRRSLAHFENSSCALVMFICCRVSKRSFFIEESLDDAEKCTMRTYAMRNSC